jgi:hypothetical protein
MPQDGRHAPTPRPDEPSAPSPWTMTWPGASDQAAPPADATPPRPTTPRTGPAPGHAPPEEPQDSAPGPTPYDLADPYPPHPRHRARRLPRPIGGPALTTLLVAAFTTLLVTAALIWPAPTP